ncbi:MAG: xanthine dehydrogenase family protein molybdopterin-binding subunit [Verrucomicrobiota bacterium]|nr:xanthine dehydrogenase family protein molybdopterin-binding subunit [Verrucomicrobiota bacterium]
MRSPEKDLENMSAVVIGPDRNRVDGRLKVTGAAKYSVEFEVRKCAYGWTVESNIAKGKITALDTKSAQAVPGVLAVLTHQNAPKLKNPPALKERGMSGGIRNEDRFPLSDAVVNYAGQYVALVVAETIEQARYAASLVKVSYAPEHGTLTMEDARPKATQPKKNNQDSVQIDKGKTADALANSQLVKIEETYITPTETHNPIEMSGTIAVWESDKKLTVYDATQFVKGAQNILAKSFGLDLENVRVICPFVGGAFGCKGAIWPHVLLAAMGAKVAGVPVKLHVTRRNMFVGTGHRTPTRQRIALAATRDGKLQAMQHLSETLTSPVGKFTESCGARSTGIMYDSPAIRVEETVYPVNVATPTFMRAPGECPGTYALECAMDELAIALKMDPVALRVANHADKHPTKDVPFSAKSLQECYSLGAEKFGWSKRNPAPRSMRDGDLLVGWGMATATYPGHKMSAAAKVILRADGSATVQCATHDLGTGAYTAFTEISSEQLGVPFEKVKFELGNSDYPFGPVAGGSNSTGTVGTAIHEVALLLHQALAELAVKDSNSPLYNQKAEEIAMVSPGRLGLKSDSSKTDGYSEILRRAGRDSIAVESKEKAPEENKKFAFQSFGAQFIEVKIDPLLPRVQVSRVVSVINCGRVVVEKQARNQIMGGIVMGIGMALTEETAYDPATGMPATRNLADYHVPTNADIPAIDVHFVGEPDFEFNPIGARGIGEIGITGTAAAVANAIYHATGKRVRDLPITPDKLLS